MNDPRELTPEEREHLGGVMDDRFGTNHLAVERETEFAAGYRSALRRPSFPAADERELSGALRISKSTAKDRVDIAERAPWGRGFDDGARAMRNLLGLAARASSPAPDTLADFSEEALGALRDLLYPLEDLPQSDRLLRWVEQALESKRLGGVAGPASAEKPTGDSGDDRAQGLSAAPSGVGAEAPRREYRAVRVVKGDRKAVIGEGGEAIHVLAGIEGVTLEVREVWKGPWTPTTVDAAVASSPVPADQSVRTWLQRDRKEYHCFRVEDDGRVVFPPAFTGRQAHLTVQLAAPVSVGDEDDPMDRCDCNIPYLEGAGQHSPGCSVFKTKGGGERA